jgi:hypothetical protein
MVEEFAVCDGGRDDGGRLQFDETGCRRLKVASVDPQDRILWLRAEVVLPDPARFEQTPIGVHTGALASREIWWNGERIGSAGVPGATRETEVAGDLDAVAYVPPRLLKAGANLVALRVSSFHNAVHVMRPMHFVFVGPYEAPGPFFLRAYAPALATTGALIAAALYFGVAFFSDRRDLGSLFIALMSLCAVGQLWAEALRGLVSYAYPLQIWRLSAIALLAFGFATALTAYVARRFEPRTWPVYVGIAVLLSAIIAPFGPGFDGKTFLLLLLPALVALFAAFRGVRARASGALAASLALLGFIGLSLAEPFLFLDRTFYLAAGGLALVLFVDQLRVLRRAREAAAAADHRASLLELELLRRGVAPHFLMNTLNALAEWVESDPKTGVKMIEAVAGEFQLLSQVSNRALIPLADEIALCRRHLEVMSYRVDSAFSLELRDSDETMQVPPGVLHTLVENAFTHGRFAAGGVFRLSREDDANAVRLVFEAPAGEPRQGGAGGQGLAYVRGRLAAAFGQEASVTSGPSPNGWKTVLTLPKAAMRAP